MVEDKVFSQKTSRASRSSVVRVETHSNSVAEKTLLLFTGVQYFYDFKYPALKEVPHKDTMQMKRDKVVKTFIQ